jgi:aryl carrier-like protein
MTSGPAADRQRWAERGLTPLDSRLCLEVFDRALTGAAGPYELVLDADWARYTARLPDGAAPALLRTVLAARGAAPARAAAARPDLAGRLAGAHPEERGALLGDHVAQRVAEALGVADARRVDREAGLFDLGLDSMTAVGLARRLSRDLGAAVELPATTVFEHPSVAALTAHLAGLLPGPDDADADPERAGADAGPRGPQTRPAGGAHPAPPGADPEPGGTGADPDGADPELEALLAEIEGLSEEETARRLAELAEHDDPFTGTTGKEER